LAFTCTVQILASSPERLCTQLKYLLFNISVLNKPFQFVLLYCLLKLNTFLFFQTDFERLLPFFSMAIIMDDLYVNLNCTICDADVLLNFCISNHLFIVPYNNTHHTFSFHFWINCFISNQFLFLFYNHYSLSCLSMHDLIEVTVNICIIFLFDISAFETTFNLTLITFITLIALDDPLSILLLSSMREFLFAICT